MVSPVTSVLALSNVAETLMDTREDAPGRNRTYGLALRRRTLYPLSYRRICESSSGIEAVFARLILYSLYPKVGIVPGAVIALPPFSARAWSSTPAVRALRSPAFLPPSGDLIYGV